MTQPLQVHLACNPMRGIFLAYAAVVLVGCRETPKANEQTPPIAGNGRMMALIDSARAVTLAVEAYRTDKGASAPMPGVLRFQRDTSGTLIYLTPVNPSVQGGGMLLRVGNDGRVAVLQRSQ